MIPTLIEALIGSPPNYTSGNTQYNYDVLEYMICAIVLIFMLSLVYRMIISIFGKR